MLIAHITDLHILKNPNPKLGMLANNAARLNETIDAISSLRPVPDVVVATGDISHEGTIEDYEHCRSLLERLPCPFLVIPGNHDDRNLLRKVFPIDHILADSTFYQFECDSYPLRIIGIDTLEVGKIEGNICSERLRWIENSLSRSEKPAVVLMHHPPYPFGLVENPDMQCTLGTKSLEELINRNGNVVAVLSGHLHVMTSTIWAGVRALTAPSVAPAFQLDIERGQLLGWRDSSPGFAVHFFQQGRELTTHVVRVDDSK